MLPQERLALVQKCVLRAIAKREKLTDQELSELLQTAE
jgi:hypothetical protein